MTLLDKLNDALPYLSTPVMKGDILTIFLAKALCGDVEAANDIDRREVVIDKTVEVIEAINKHYAPLGVELSKAAELMSQALLFLRDKDAEIERLRAALGPLLSEKARQRILEEIESDEAMGSTQLAADLQILLDGDSKRRAVLKSASSKGTTE